MLVLLPTALLAYAACSASAAALSDHVITVCFLGPWKVDRHRSAVKFSCARLPLQTMCEHVCIGHSNLLTVEVLRVVLLIVELLRVVLLLRMVLLRVVLLRVELLRVVRLRVVLLRKVLLSLGAAEGWLQQPGPGVAAGFSSQPEPSFL